MFLGSCKEIGRDYSEREGEKVTRGMRTRDRDRERKKIGGKKGRKETRPSGQGIRPKGRWWW